jgi:hypothetical protein
MTIYNDVFGGANVYPSEISYSAIALSANVVLSWPEETSANDNLATRIIDVTPSTTGLSIYLPAANKTGVGNTILFNNRGSNTFTVRDASGTQVVTVPTGTLWQVYLTNNSTVAGVWQSLQYGATTSIANASALAGTGIVAVGTLLSQSVPISTFNNNYTAGVTDRAKMFNWTGAGGTLTLPDPATVQNNWFLYLRNSGSGAVVADPTGLTTINGLLSLSFQPGESAIIVSDGANFYTIGFGQQAIFAFDYTVINIPGSGSYTLTGSELNRIAYRFTGALTANRTVIVPATVQQYWVDNKTTGAYTLTITPFGGGLGFDINQGSRAILYCDGTDVINASTGGLAVPLAIADGGTGATTASNARINLGGTSTGIAVFTAASQAAAQSSLGGTSTGIAVFTAASQAAARTALGGTTTGSALFTAVDQAAAWTALGVAQAGNINGGTF